MTNSSDKIWDIRANTIGRRNFAFFVTNDKKYGVYFSRFDEYGMLKFVSSVQIWTDKERPRLLFQSEQIKFEYQDEESCYYLDKSDILVLLTPCIHQKYFELLYIIFDFNKNVFTTINAPNFRLTEINRNFVRLDLCFRYVYNETAKRQIAKEDGKQIDLTQLEWYDIKNIDDLCSMATKNNR